MLVKIKNKQNIMVNTKASKTSRLLIPKAPKKTKKKKVSLDREVVRNIANYLR